MEKKTKKQITEAIMKGAHLKRSGKPMPYLKGDADLDFSERGKDDRKSENITKAFETIIKQG